VNLKEARIQKEYLCKVCMRQALGPVLRKSEDSDRCKECTKSGVSQLFMSSGGRALSDRGGTRIRLEEVEGRVP